MKVKELKAILNELPDDAIVIVSEKLGRGGEATISRTIGNDETQINNEMSMWIDDVEKYTKDLSDIVAGKASLKKAGEGRTWIVVDKQKWFGIPDEETGEYEKNNFEKLAKEVMGWIEEAQKNITRCKKQLKNKRVEAIELSCGY